MEIQEIITPPKTIAVVGLSDKPERPSYDVAAYLQQNGFRIIPVNPNITNILGESSYPSISAIPNDVQIDVVDIFRRSEEVPAIVDEVIMSGRKPVIWMQEGVVSEEARAVAKAAGLTVVMDKCMKKAHQGVY